MDAATSRLLDSLRSAIGAANVLTRDSGGANLAPWEQDWRQRSNGHALAVLRPASTAEVVQVLRLCIAQQAANSSRHRNTSIMAR